ncbi:MAG: BlaI/MecI/CopY family transcriptional regulator [Verrucomicrobiales bacterium]|nr:BlaI/MecI/CopY family transcriptional regulator [Verrucomicrobiales bacterium]
MSHFTLPPAERDVLACLHQAGEATARDLREKLEAYRPMSHASVVTLLTRLAAKGLVAKEKGPVGKAFVFRPARRKGSAFRGAVNELVQRVFHGDPITLVASLFEGRAPTTEQVTRLEALLEDLKARQSGGKEEAS